MTKEEFLAKMSETDDFAPGWDAIEAEFSRLYPGQEPSHYGTTIAKRAMFGGDQYLDGYSIYTSPKGYQHVVTFGMTCLYGDAEAFGGEYSGWGYEMTIKLREETPESCLWAMDMLANLARYTYTSGRYFEPLQYMRGNGTPLHIGTDSAISALIFVADTEAAGLDTVYGKTGFIQLVGVTGEELRFASEAPGNAGRLIERMRADNPDLVTDMSRTKS